MFLRAITNVISKSQYKEGFDQIRAKSSANMYLSDRSRVMTGMSRMFWKMKTGSAFTKWREQNYRDNLAAL